MDGYPDISEETRQRVIQTAREMGYVPNRAARQLRRKKADAIGYVLPSNTPRFADPFYTEFIAGLGDETARHPFDLTISIAPPGEEAEKRLYQSWVQGHKVDGFILTHVRLQDWRVEYLSQQGISFSALEDTLDGYDFPRIEIDRQGGIIELIVHLADRGFRRIACVGGPANLQIQARQFDGYCQGLGAVKLPFDSRLVTLGDLTNPGGYQATKRLLSIPDPPDAIMCINDETAFGSLHALRDLGISIGTELAVSGFDGVAMSAYSDPPLTTLDVPVYEIACKLVELLAAELKHEASSERIITFTPRLLKNAPQPVTVRLEIFSSPPFGRLALISCSTSRPFFNRWQVRRLEKNILPCCSPCSQNKEGNYIMHNAIFEDLVKACEQPGCPVSRLENNAVDHYLQDAFRASANDLAIRQDLQDSLGLCREHSWWMLNLGLENTIAAAMGYHDVLLNVHMKLQHVDLSPRTPKRLFSLKKRTSKTPVKFEAVVNALSRINAVLPAVTVKPSPVPF